MTARLLGNSHPLPYVRDADALQNGCELAAESFRGLAGNTRCIAEALGGLTTSVDPCAPRCWFSGLPGHDHGGGVMGVPIQRTIWSAVFGVADEDADKPEQYGLGPQTQVTSSITEAALYHNILRGVWVPGCSPDGCYWGLELSATVYASATADFTATVDNAGQTFEDTVRVTVGDTTQHAIFDLGKVRMIPGRRQHMNLRISAEYVAASSVVALYSLGLHQTSATP